MIRRQLQQKMLAWESRQLVLEPPGAAKDFIENPSAQYQAAVQPKRIKPARIPVVMG